MITPQAEPIYSENEFDAFIAMLDKDSTARTVELDQRWAERIERTWNRGDKLLFGAWSSDNNIAEAVDETATASGEALVGGAMIKKRESLKGSVVELELLFLSDEAFERHHVQNISETLLESIFDTCSKYGYDMLFISIDTAIKKHIYTTLNIINVFVEKGFELHQDPLNTESSSLLLIKHLEGGCTEDRFDVERVVEWLCKQWNIEDVRWSSNEQERLYATGKVAIDKNCGMEIPLALSTPVRVSDDKYGKLSDLRARHLIHLGAEKTEHPAGNCASLSSLRKLAKTQICLHELKYPAVVVSIRGGRFSAYEFRKNCIYVDGGKYGRLLHSENPEIKGFIVFVDGDLEKTFRVLGVGEVSEIKHSSLSRMWEYINKRDIMHSFSGKSDYQMYHNIKTSMTGFVFKLRSDKKVGPELTMQSAHKVVGKPDFRKTTKFRTQGFRYMDGSDTEFIHTNYSEVL